MGEPGVISDEALAEHAAARGSEARAAFTVLFHRYERRLLGFVRSRVDQDADAENLASDAWLRVWQKLPTWTPGHFRGWLFTIAGNLVIDHFDRSRVRRTKPLSAAENVGDSLPEPMFADESAKLRACLDRLKPEFRDAFLHHAGGLGGDEQSVAQGVPAETVRTRVFRARKSLQECLGVSAA